MNDQPDQNLQNPQNGQPQPPANQTQGQQLPPQRSSKDWSGVGGGRVVGAFITVGVIFVILMLLMKTCSGPTIPLSSSTADNPSGGNILQQRVDEAFSEEETPNVAIPPSQQPSFTPEQQQAQDAQQQKDLAIQREQELQRQREAVPSLLPENPPAPAKLGDY